MVNRSFFLTQLERRGIHLAAGPQSYLLATIRVGDLIRREEDKRSAPEAHCWELIEQGSYLDAGATLETAFPAFDRSGEPFLPVVALTGPDTPPELKGLCSTLMPCAPTTAPLPPPRPRNTADQQT
jgi:chloride channel protein, CIC family